MSDSDPRRFLKPRVREMAAYTLAPRLAAVKVNQNECPWDLPEALKQEIVARALAEPWSRYPDFVPAALCEAVAGFAGWRADGVLPGNGSNELIQVVLGCAVGERTPVVLPEPTFTLYRKMVTVFGGRTEVVPLRDDLGFDVDGLLAAAERTSAPLIVVNSPNNPTGQALSEADVLRLLREHDGLLVLDEAYHEFSGWTAAPLLAEHRNLVILRTFSKAVGLAGIRFGYLLADPELTTQLDKARLPYNVGRLTQAAVHVAVEHYDDVLRPRIDAMVRMRDDLRDAVAAIDGLAPVPSAANFMLVRCPWSPGDVCEALFQRGVLARNVSSYPMLDHYFRINVGTDEENAAVVAALTQVARELGS